MNENQVSEHDCPRCHRAKAEIPHSCPYQREINDNTDDAYCVCCASCQQDCSDNI